MINNKDIVDRLELLMGKELTSENLHETIFCEGKHQKILRRFNLGKYSYIQYKIIPPSFADIVISGNPNTFRIGIKEKDGKHVVNSAPRISYTYL
ncbi:hypothetical protein [Pseudoneobacillus sp. C159]